MLPLLRRERRLQCTYRDRCDAYTTTLVMLRLRLRLEAIDVRVRGLWSSAVELSSPFVCRSPHPWQTAGPIRPPVNMSRFGNGAPRALRNSRMIVER